MRFAVVVLGLFFLGACSHVHSYNQDGFLPAAGREISETREKTVWFNFNFENTFIEEARAAFYAQCQSGTVHGVSSRLSSENGVFYWISRVHFRGVCVSGVPQELGVTQGPSAQVGDALANHSPLVGSEPSR